jgi:hypothetical protein
MSPDPAISLHQRLHLHALILPREGIVLGLHFQSRRTRSVLHLAREVAIALIDPTDAGNVLRSFLILKQASSLIALPASMGDFPVQIAKIPLPVPTLVARVLRVGFARAQLPRRRRSARQPPRSKSRDYHASRNIAR